MDDDRPAVVPHVPVHPAQQRDEPDDDGPDPVADGHDRGQAVAAALELVVVLGAHVEEDGLGAPELEGEDRSHLGLAVVPGGEREGRGSRPWPLPPGRHQERGEVLALHPHPGDVFERPARGREARHGDVLDLLRAQDALGGDEALDLALLGRWGSRSPGPRGAWTGPPGPRARRRRRTDAR